MVVNGGGKKMCKFSFEDEFMSLLDIIPSSPDF